MNNYNSASWLVNIPVKSPVPYSSIVAAKIAIFGFPMFISYQLELVEWNSNMKDSQPPRVVAWSYNSSKFRKIVSSISGCRVDRYVSQLDCEKCWPLNSYIDQSHGSSSRLLNFLSYSTVHYSGDLHSICLSKLYRSRYRCHCGQLHHQPALLHICASGNILLFL